ncbi:UPF0421 protein [Pullulanibacillus camelliae]|uniref:UPF0421 protein n=1 Tax=Pullulanibacillus camelliae TaxID=1707096 RepID=A0A8J2VKQ1_9BACL|nr:aromatic acid exporter family protein [Pullulanibacillus camelliae]GGE28712.1 UPF0421 protein [Pullulanibacillus camelliae]
MQWVLKRSFIGSRILKSCLAAFVTALICEALDWPPLFAVMTAIVSIENTSVDSVKKGMIRFPASAIGAAFAMFFEGLFGRGALTYGFSASLTLIACFKLKLYDGMVVAVLTAVAMIPATYGHYLDSFIIRLGTTLTGIAVATGINYFILPPNYQKVIDRKTEELTEEATRILRTVLESHKNGSRMRLRHLYQECTKTLEFTFRLVHFQRSEWRYHRHHMQEVRDITFYQRRLEQLQKIMYHLGNLIYAPVDLGVFTAQDQELLRRFIEGLAHHLKEAPNQKMGETAFDAVLGQVDELYSRTKQEQNKTADGHYHLTPKLMIVYELLSIYEIITLNNVCGHAKREKHS